MSLGGRCKKCEEGDFLPFSEKGKIFAIWKCPVCGNVIKNE